MLLTHTVTCQYCSHVHQWVGVAIAALPEFQVLPARSAGLRHKLWGLPPGELDQVVGGKAQEQVGGGSRSGERGAQ